MKTALPPIEIQRQDRVRQNVREHYGRIAQDSDCGCSPTCCTTEGARKVRTNVDASAAATVRLGYSAADALCAPDGSNLGLGCGNPLAIASLRPGQTVLDLGCGAGFDAFLAARAVGTEGTVIGVDMTPAMVSKARENAARTGHRNTQFRLGEIENLPVADASVDVIISNCVINLSPDKQRVFAESWRVLKPGGRLAISDVVALVPVPQAMRDDAQLYAACASGASLVSEVEELLRATGFTNILVLPKPDSGTIVGDCFPGKGLEKLFASATIEAVKPAAA